ncbi:MAG: protein kinase family protein [Trebonia sp.]
MSTYTSEPGTRLAGRYRLVDQMVTGNGWTLWKAIDETLARPVSILTFASGFPRIPQVVTAARAASRLTDPRMAQVFDVEDGGGQAYIVLEWVGGDSLTEILDAGGPLDPGRACSLICDASRAVAGAHALGQAHLRLTPDTLRWTRGSGIKITGLGLDAALAGEGLTGDAARDPSIADTVALAALLYAALTGYWPGEEPTRLPAAPVSDGVVCTPRQVSADVSSAIDSVITRALLQRPTRHGPPIQSPAEFADALAAVSPPAPLPEPAPPAPAGYQGRGGYDGYGGGYGPDPNNPDSWAVPGPSGTAPYQPPSQQYPAGYGGGQYTGAQYSAAGYPREKRGVSRVMVTVVVVLVLVVAAVLVWVVGFRKSPSSTATGGGHPTISTSAPADGTVLTPVSDSTFNILGSDTEDSAQEANAIDGSASTFWGTDTYQNHANFGNLKAGTGLLIDMGKAVQLSKVEVSVGKTCCTTAEIYLGNSAAMSKTALQNFTLVGQKTTGTGTLTYSVTSKATGRYVLIWLTGNLPPDPDQPGQYQGRIYNVVVRGSAASGNS